MTIIPNTVCQIYFCLGHSVAGCPQRYNSRPSKPIVPAFATFNAGKTSDTMWFPDLAVASHMTPFKSNFSSKSVCIGSTRVRIADDTLLPIAAIGEVSLPSCNRNITLRNVCHVPSLKHNLFSVKCLCSDNNCVNFDASTVSIKDRATGKVLLPGTSKGNIYPLRLPLLEPPSESSVMASLAINESADLWHRRLGHCVLAVLDILRKNKAIVTTKFDTDYVPCRLGKSHRSPYCLVAHTY